MALVVGLDIGSRTVTGAVFNGKTGHFRLVDFFVEVIPTIESSVGREQAAGEGGEIETPLSLEEVLAKTLRERELEAAEVVASVEMRDCVVREFQVPFTREEQITRTILFEAENHFPGLDLESATLEYLKVGERGGKSQLVVWALPNEKIEKRLAMFRSAGVDPVALDLDAAALFNAFALTPVFDPERTSLIVEMGATATKILLVEKGALKKARSLRLETFVPSPERLIPEPVGAGASGGAPRVALEVVGEGAAADLNGFSFEARFREIEEALQRLDPLAAAEDEEGADWLAAATTPIAILSDEDYDLVREETAAGEEPLDEAEPDGSPDPSRRPEEAPAGGAPEPEAEDEEPERRSGAAEGGGPRFPGQDLAGPTFDYGDYLQRIALEIQRSLVGVHLESPIELICLTGGMSGREEARRFFTEQFDVETVHLDFGRGDSFQTTLEPEKQSAVGRLGAVAVGLAVKLLGGDRVGLDFRKGRFRYEHRFEKVKIPLLVAATLFFLVSLQLTFWTIQPWKKEKQRASGYEKRSLVAYETYFGEKPIPGLDPLTSARKMRDSWKGQGGGRTDRFLDVAEVLQDFSEVMKSTAMWFTINRMDFNFRVRPRTGTAPSGAKGGARMVADASKIDLDTNDRSAVVKVQNAFRGPQSKVFDCTASLPSSRGDMVKVHLDLAVKEKKLQELQ